MVTLCTFSFVQAYENCLDTGNVHGYYLNIQKDENGQGELPLKKERDVTELNLL
jgi:hypothetical protein